MSFGRFVLSALLCLVLEAGAGAQPSPPPPPAPPPGPPPPGGMVGPPNMMSESFLYCRHLQDRFVREQHFMPPPTPDVLMLAAEGQRLCEHGQLRPGIMRLRRALMLLREGA